MKPILNLPRTEGQIDYVIDKLEEEYSQKLSNATSKVSPIVRIEIRNFVYKLYSNNIPQKQIHPTFDFKNITALKKALDVPKLNLAWDKGWVLKNSTTSFARAYGQFLVYKYGESKLIEPGSFILNEKLSDNNNETSVDIKIKIFEEIPIENSVWYFLRGNYYLSYHNIIRFYFSFNFREYEKILEFLKSLKGSFNERLIPFVIKFEIEFSERHDNLVLYVQQQHYFIVFHIINEFYFRYKNSGIFRDHQPLFTLPLLPGIGFAEDPNLSMQSFGTHRSSIISEAFIKFYQKKERNIDVKVYIKDEIRKSFSTLKQRKTFSIEDFYRNPNSKFPYDFSIMGTQPFIYRFSENPSAAHLNYAYHLGKIICKLGLIIREKNTTKCYWISTKKDEFDQSSILCEFIDNSFENGKLGIAYLLARLYNVFRNDYIMKEICKLIIEELKDCPEKEKIREIEQILMNSDDLTQKKLTINQKIHLMTHQHNEFDFDKSSFEGFRAYESQKGNESAISSKNYIDKIGDSKSNFVNINPLQDSDLNTKQEKTEQIKPFFDNQRAEELFKIRKKIPQIIENLENLDHYSKNSHFEFIPTLSENGFSMMSLAFLEIIDTES